MTSAEKASKTRGQLQRWARVITGLDQKEILRDRTVMSEKYRAEDQSPEDVVERATGKKEVLK